MMRFFSLLYFLHNITRYIYRFYCGNLEQSYLILEDLTAVNYKNVARIEGLSMNQMKFCLKTLALWHAASNKLIKDVSNSPSTNVNMTIDLSLILSFKNSHFCRKALNSIIYS